MLMKLDYAKKVVKKVVIRMIYIAMY